MSNQQRFVRTSKGIIDINLISMVQEEEDGADIFLVGEENPSLYLKGEEAKMFLKLYVPISGDTTVL